MDSKVIIGRKTILGRKSFEICLLGYSKTLPTLPIDIIKKQLFMRDFATVIPSILNICLFLKNIYI